jgi:hypothetical protein
MHDYFDLKSAARRCGVTYQQLWYAVRRAKTAPAPKRRVGGLAKRYYSQADVDAMMPLFAKARTK